MAEQWLIDGNQLFEFLSDQLIREAGMFSKGVNKGLNIARSAIHNMDAANPVDPETLPIVRQLREELARVTEERDAAVRDRAKLADYELSVCEGFCFGDAPHSISMCEWLVYGKCKLREWRGRRKEATS